MKASYSFYPNQNDVLVDRKNISYHNTKKDNNYINQKDHSEEKGLIALMCPYCYDYTFANIDNKIDATTSNIEYNSKYRIYPKLEINYYCKICSNCNLENINLIKIDANIVEIISLLNQKGFHTKFCCEGHNFNYYYSSGYISFEDRSIMEYIHLLPDDFYLDIEDFKNYNKIIIRFGREGIESKKENLNNLLIWAKTLPYKGIEYYKER